MPTLPSFSAPALLSLLAFAFGAPLQAAAAPQAASSTQDSAVVTSKTLPPSPDDHPAVAQTGTKGSLPKKEQRKRERAAEKAAREKEKTPLT